MSAISTRLYSDQFPSSLSAKLSPNQLFENTAISNLLDGFLALSGSCFLYSDEVAVRSVATEFLEKSGLSDAGTAIYHVEIVGRGLERCREGVEFLHPAVEGQTLGNDYCDNDTAFPPLSSQNRSLWYFEVWYFDVLSSWWVPHVPPAQ